MLHGMNTAAPKGNAPTGPRTRPRRRVLIGLDLGTSSLKALALTPTGVRVAEAEAAYPTATPQAGWAEQAPDDWWRAAGVACRALMARCGDDADVLGVGLSGQMHTFVLAREDGRPVRPAITWLDTRAGPGLGAVAATIDAAGLAAELANPAVLGLTLPPLTWLRDHEPEALRGARYLLLAKDHLRHRLTGTFGSEPTDASATLLFDVPRRTWSTATWDAFGLPVDLMPPLGEPGAVAGALTDAAAEHLGLPPGVPVAYGAGDQQAAALGTGTIAPGQRQLMVGTGAQALVVTSSPGTADRGELHTFCHVDGWLSQASVQSAGAALTWARSVLGLGWGALVATLVDPSLDDAPTFLPYLSGERTPLMKGYARGAWLGLAPHHGRRHLARAAVEGVIGAIAAGVAALPDAGAPGSSLPTAGGGVRDARFAQALADATGRRLEVLRAPSASARGAAWLGGVAAGLFPDAAAAVASAPPRVAATFVPHPAAAAAWAEKLARSRSLDGIGLHETMAL